MSSTDNKRIAKNAFFLYLRKGFAIIIGLYSSRLLLQRLGIDDFGLYGLVGSVVIMFNAIKFIFSDSVQRYINIAKGQGKQEKVGEIFSIGINVHILLSILFILAVEIGGYFILENLSINNIPYWQVQVIFQFSLATAITTLLTVPYDALIIANERFGAYALLSILDIVLRLISIILLVLFHEYRVIWYAVLIFTVSIIIRIISTIFCKKKFGEEARYRRTKNFKLAKEMTSFAGWNFLGNLGYWTTFSGTDFILNHFGGLAVNAARGIAVQVFANFQQFIGDLNMSFRPRSTMLYAQKKYNEYYKLVILNTKFDFFICSVLCLIFITFINVFLKIWLSVIPEYTPIFCQTILLYSLIRCLRGPIDIFFKAIGELKLFQIVEFAVTIMNLPISWYMLSCGAPLYTVFLVMAFLEIINYISIVLLASLRYGFNGRFYFSRIGARLILCLTVNVIIFFILNNHRFLNDISIGMIVEIFVVSIIVVIINSIIIFNKSELQSIINIIRSK